MPLPDWEDILAELEKRKSSRADVEHYFAIWKLEKAKEDATIGSELKSALGRGLLAIPEIPFNLADMASDASARLFGTGKNPFGLFGMGTSPTQEVIDTIDSWKPDPAVTLPGRIAEGVATAPATIAEMYPFISTMGPAAGMAAYSGLKSYAEDKSVEDVIKSTVFGGLAGGAFEAAEPLGRFGKTLASGAIGATQTAVESGGNASPEDVVAGSISLMLLSALPAGKLHSGQRIGELGDAGFFVLGKRADDLITKAKDAGADPQAIKEKVASTLLENGVHVDDVKKLFGFATEAEANDAIDAVGRRALERNAAPTITDTRSNLDIGSLGTDRARDILDAYETRQQESTPANVPDDLLLSQMDQHLADIGGLQLRRFGEPKVSVVDSIPEPQSPRLADAVEDNQVRRELNAAQEYTNAVDEGRVPAVSPRQDVINRHPEYYDEGSPTYRLTSEDYLSLEQENRNRYVGTLRRAVKESGANVNNAQIDDYVKLHDARAMSWARANNATPAEYWDRYSTASPSNENFSQMSKDELISRGFSSKDAEDISSGKKSVKGFTEFLDDGKAVVNIMGSADIGTLLHEASHVYRSDMPPADLAIVGKYLGVKGGNWSRGQEEKFADMMLSYFKDGQAPSPELVGPFSRFHGWLNELYSDKTANSLVSPEVRPALDALFNWDLVKDRFGKVPDEGTSIPGAPHSILTQLEDNGTFQGEKQTPKYTTRQQSERWVADNVDKPHQDMLAADMTDKAVWWGKTGVPLMSQAKTWLGEQTGRLFELSSNALIDRSNQLYSTFLRPVMESLSKIPGGALSKEEARIISESLSAGAQPLQGQETRLAPVHEALRSSADNAIAAVRTAIEKFSGKGADVTGARAAIAAEINLKASMLDPKVRDSLASIVPEHQIAMEGSSRSFQDVIRDIEASGKGNKYWQKILAENLAIFPKEEASEADINSRIATMVWELNQRATSRSIRQFVPEDGKDSYQDWSKMTGPLKVPTELYSEDVGSSLNNFVRTMANKASIYEDKANLNGFSFTQAVDSIIGGADLGKHQRDTFELLRDLTLNQKPGDKYPIWGGWVGKMQSLYKTVALIGRAPISNYISTAIQQGLDTNNRAFVRGLMNSFAEDSPGKTSGVEFGGIARTSTGGSSFQNALRAINEHLPFTLSEEKVRQQGFDIGLEHIKDLVEQHKNGDVTAAHELQKYTADTTALIAEMLDKSASRETIGDIGRREFLAAAQFTRRSALPMEATYRPQNWTQHPLGQLLATFRTFGLRKWLYDKDKILGPIQDGQVMEAKAIAATDPKLKQQYTQAANKYKIKAGVTAANLLGSHVLGGLLINGIWNGLTGRWDQSYIQRMIDAYGEDNAAEVIRSTAGAAADAGIAGLLADGARNLIQFSKSNNPDDLADQLYGFNISRLSDTLKFLGNVGSTVKTVVSASDDMTTGKSASAQRWDAVRNLERQSVQTAQSFVPGLRVVTDLPAKMATGFDLPELIDADRALDKARKGMASSSREGRERVFGEWQQHYTEAVLRKLQQLVSDGDYEGAQRLQDYVSSGRLESYLQQKQIDFYSK